MTQLLQSLRTFIKNNWLLLGIVALALFIRLTALGNLPLHLHQDEIMNGYVGRFILQNGKDLRANPWPLLYFDNFGDYPNVIPMYLSGLFTYVFGINEFAIRFPIAVAGGLTVLVVYGISQLVTKHKPTSLFVAFALAILPWHVVLSRATAENVTAGFVFLTGIYCLLKGLQEKNQRFILFSLPLFFSTYFLYPSFRVLIPLLLLPTFLLATKHIRKILLVATVLFFVLTLVIGKTTWGSGRFKQTSVFTFNGMTNARAVHYALNIHSAKYIPFIRVFNNKLVINAREILRQYLSYLSPQFLFMNGGLPNRYLVPDQGLLYISFALLLAGLCAQLYVLPATVPKNAKLPKPLVLFLLYILALSILPASLTLDEVPNVHRSALLGIMLLFPVSWAFYMLYNVKIGKIRVIVPLMLLLVLECAYFFNQYIFHSPTAQAVERYDNRTILAKYILKTHTSYTTVYLPREIFSVYILFYSKNFDPSLAGQFKTNLVIPQIDNIVFIDNDCPSEETRVNKEGNVLIVDLERCSNAPGLSRLQHIENEYSTTTYKLYIPTPVPPVTEKR